MNGRRAAALGALATLMASATAAQPFAAPPPVAAPRPVVIAAPVVQTLGNGLRVIVAQRKGTPLVTALLVVRSGAEADPAALSGLADLTATLLTKGTATRSAPSAVASLPFMAWYRPCPTRRPPAACTRS